MGCGMSKTSAAAGLEPTASQAGNPEESASRPASIADKKSSSRETPKDRRSTKTRARKPSNYNLVHAAAIKQLYQHAGEGGLPPGVAGLPNYGNTCFFNSTVQSLFATPPLADYFLGYEYTTELNPKNDQGSKGAAVAKSFGEIMKRIWAGGGGVQDVKALHKALCGFHTDFGDRGQHDVAESLGFLLDAIHEDLNRVVGKKEYVEDVERELTINPKADTSALDTEEEAEKDEEVAAKAWEGYLKRNRSIVVDLFQGQLRSTLTCRNKAKNRGRGCGRQVRKFEPFMYLTLPLKNKSPTVKAAVEDYCQEETMDGDNQWYCSACKEHVRATKKFDIWKVPPILIVHLKRFNTDSRGRGSKINDVVKYPVVDFDLARYIRSPNLPESTSFDLYSIAMHHGGSNGGHYTALGKNRCDGEWYDLNDSRASRADEREIENNAAAYVLFYANMVDCEDDEESSVTSSGRKTQKIRRQSITMPHLWPHIADKEQKLKIRDSLENRGSK
jgi:ubiquitin carboxyl-terminal hydrolase 8